jgi:hypothetical protein
MGITSLREGLKVMGAACQEEGYGGNSVPTMMERVVLLFEFIL